MGPIYTKLCSWTSGMRATPFLSLNSNEDNFFISKWVYGRENEIRRSRKLRIHFWKNKTEQKKSSTRLQEHYEASVLFKCWWHFPPPLTRRWHGRLVVPTTPHIPSPIEPTSSTLPLSCLIVSCSLAAFSTRACFSFSSLSTFRFACSNLCPVVTRREFSPEFTVPRAEFCCMIVSTWAALARASLS